MEAIGAVAFTVILAIPFLLQLLTLVADSDTSTFKQLISLWSNYTTQVDQTSPEILQYYPKDSISFSTVSDSRVIVGQLRATSSSPVLSPDSASKVPSQKTLLPARHSSSFVKTEQVVPVVDISWNYEWYRFKAFEASLRSRYGVNYPPGEVILNSMQLNLPDSRTRVVGAGNLTRGLFDFLRESELALCNRLSRTLEIECLNPLDHFVARHRAKALTEEKWTETKDQKSEEPTEAGIVRPASPIDTVTLERTKEHVLDCQRLLKVNQVSHIPQQRLGKIPRQKFKK